MSNYNQGLSVDLRIKKNEVPYLLAGVGLIVLTTMVTVGLIGLSIFGIGQLFTYC